MILKKLNKKLVTVLISLILYLPLGILFTYYFRLFESHLGHVPITMQESMYGVVKTLGQIPEKIANLPDHSSYPGFREKCLKNIDYYNPEAWQDPQRIFFSYKRKGFYSVTFGDGSSAILKYWSPAQTTEDDKIKYLYSRVNFFTYWGHITILGVIGILIATQVSNRIFRSKKVSKVEDD